MTSLRVCAVLVLFAVAAVSAHPHHGHGPMHEAMKQDITQCASDHNIDDIKATMKDPNSKDKCFFECLLSKAEERTKDSQGPFRKDLDECKKANPSTDDKCLDAFNVKVCMMEKFKEMRKRKHAEKEEE